MKNIVEMQLRQLERLLATKKINFRDSFQIIFSDYPSISFINHLLERDYDIDDKMIIKLTKYKIKLMKGAV